MLIVLEYAALYVLAVNVAFVVGLLSSQCLLRHYIFDVFYYVNCCLVDCSIVLFCGAWLRVLY